MRDAAPQLAISDDASSASVQDVALLAEKRLDGIDDGPTDEEVFRCFSGLRATLSKG
jgi:hypothetical protein